MKSTTRLFAVAVFSMTLAVGCKPAAHRTSDEDITGQQIARTEAAVVDARHNLDAYTYDQKAQFIAAMEADMAAINRSINELSVRIERSAADVKAAANPRLNELRNQASLLEARINEVKGSTATTWDTVKANTRETYDNLINNFDDARQWMSDKLAP